MKSIISEISLGTSEGIEFLDVTDLVRNEVKKSEVQNGFAIVMSKHTTACVRIIEKCEKLQEDMRRFLMDTVPEGAYFHDVVATDGRPNARGHIMALFMNASEIIPVENGMPLLGEWQSIFLAELDGPRNRKITVKIFGE